MLTENVERDQFHGSARDCGRPANGVCRRGGPSLSAQNECKALIATQVLVTVRLAARWKHTNLTSRNPTDVY